MTATHPDLPHPTLPPARQRVQWIDYAKGIAIILVVFFHVWRGLGERIRIDPELFSPIDRALEMTHMPAFFLLAGLFLARSIQKGVGAFVSDKVRTIAWPYVVWSTVAVLAGLVLAKLTHSRPEIPLAQLPQRLACRPVNEFWFLYVLLMGMMVMVALVKLRCPGWLVFLLSLAFYYMGGVPWDRVRLTLAGTELSLVHFGPFFQLQRFLWALALGVWWGPWLVRRMPTLPTMMLVLMALTGAGVVWFSVTHHSLPFYKMTIDRTAPVEFHLNIGPFFALCAVVGVLALAGLMDRVRGLGWIRQAGEDSLQIYVLHVLCLATARLLLFKLNVRALEAHLLAGMIAGVALPMVIAHLARRWRMSAIFTLPKRVPMAQ